MCKGIKERLRPLAKLLSQLCRIHVRIAPEHLHALVACHGGHFERVEPHTEEGRGGGVSEVVKTQIFQHARVWLDTLASAVIRVDPFGAPEQALPWLAE